MRLIESNSLLVDESTLTGESMPLEKDASIILPKDSLPYELKNMALSGTFIVKGSGKTIVVRTGWKHISCINCRKSTGKVSR